jgi:hypothetical protein
MTDVSIFRLDEINIRDPFILPADEERRYYLFGTTYRSGGRKAAGFDCYRSTNLFDWQGPLPAFRAPEGWDVVDFWSPEVYRREAGDYVMFATLAGEGGVRGTFSLRSGDPAGPYRPYSDGPLTPSHWQCLDGTLHVDYAGRAWMVFCHEWVQVHDGAMLAVRLSDDLRRAVDRPVFLFSASQAPWAKAITVPPHRLPVRFPCYVTDGPWLHRAGPGDLLMLWSSFSGDGYAEGVARSDDGTITGRWHHLPEPIYAADGGHGMIFTDFTGRLLHALHAPNTTPGEERTRLLEVQETPAGLGLTGA